MERPAEFRTERVLAGHAGQGDPVRQTGMAPWSLFESDGSAGPGLIELIHLLLVGAGSQGAAEPSRCRAVLEHCARLRNENEKGHLAQEHGRPRS